MKMRQVVPVSDPPWGCSNHQKLDVETDSHINYYISYIHGYVYHTSHFVAASLGALTRRGYAFQILTPCTHILGSCRTCRRRHVRCDTNRPACETCAAVGLTCEGFADEIQ